MSVHGVNRLTDSAETWYVLPTYDPMQPDQTRRDRSRRDRLSALTWVLFRGVLGIDPLTASRVLTTSILAVNNQDAATGQTTTANTSPQEPELDRQVRVVLTADPERVHQALRACADHQNPVIAVAAESLLQVVNQIHTATGDLRGALVAAVAATRLLRSPLVLPRTVSTAGVGEYLADAMTEPADNRSNGRDPA